VPWVPWLVAIQFPRIAKLHANVERFGLTAALFDVFYRVVNLFAPFKILQGVKIEKVDSSYLECNPRYEMLFLPEHRLRELGRNPEYELPEGFLNEALARGDDCLAILDGERLASYGWYSRKRTPIDLPGVVLNFSNEYVYMYKGFTHPQYRGQRLHAIGMTTALQAYLAQGYRGLISYVEANNTASLKSVYRMGYQDFGKIGVVRILGRYFFFSGDACEALGFRLEAGEPPAARKAREAA
jgi:hypothetical protein